MNEPEQHRTDLTADSVLEDLILDLLDWLAGGERSYEEVLDAWRTSCPRLPVWEDANDRGLVQIEQVNRCSVVRATPLGLSLLQRRRPIAQHQPPQFVTE